MQNTQWKLKKIIFAAVVGVVAGVVILLAGGARFWITSGDGQRMIQEQINGAIPGTLTWEDLSLSVFAGEIELKHPRLLGPSGEELISVDRLLLNISWADLFRKNLTAEKAILEAPRVVLATDPDGGLNILKAFVAPSAPDEPSDSEGEFTFNVLIDDLSLTDGFFRYELRSASKPPQHITIRDIGFTLTHGDLDEESGRFSLSTGKAEMDMAEIQTGLETFRFDGRLHRGNLLQATLATQGDLARLEAAGDVDAIFRSPLFDIDLNLQGELSNSTATFEIPTDLTGPVDLSLSMHGPLGNPGGNLSLTHGGGNIAGNQVDHMTLACQLKDKQVEVTQLDLHTPLGQLAVTGEVDLRKAFADGFTSAPTDLEAMAYKLTLKQAGTRLDRLFGPATDITGEAASTLELEGSGISPEALSVKALWDLSVNHLAMDDVLSPFDLSLKAQAEMENQEITISHLDARTKETRLKASGTYDLSSETVSAMLSLTASDLSEFVVPYVADYLSGQASLDVLMSGDITQPEVDARLSGEGLAAAGLPLGSLQAHANMDSAGLLTLMELTLENNDTQLTAGGTMQLLKNGEVTDLPSDLAVNLTRLNIQDYLPDAGLTGELGGTLTAKGPLLFPEASLSLQGRSLAAGENLAGDLDASLHLDRGRLHIDEMRAQSGKSELTLSGSARLLDAETGAPVDHPEFDATLGGTGLFLEDFIKGMHGRLTVSGHLNGDTQHPKGSLSVSGTDLDLGVQKIHAISMDSRITRDRVTVDALNLALTPEEYVAAEGWLSLADLNYAIRVVSPGVSMENIEAIGEKNAAEGLIALKLTGKGDLDAPTLDGEVLITRLRLNEEPFPDSTIRLSLQDDIVLLNGDLIADLEGRFNVSTRDFLASARLEKTGLAPFFNMINRSDLTGSITGLIEVEGNAEAPEKIRAVAEISQLSISLDTMELVRAGEFHASIDNGTILVPGINLTLFDQGHLNISGEGKLDGAMDFTADGAIPFEVIYLLTDDLTGVTGDIQVGAYLKGNLEDPDFQADIKLNDLGLTLPVLDQKLHSVTGQILVSPESLNVEKVIGNLDNGNLELSGTLALKDFIPTSVDARLTAQALPIALPDTLETLINAKLTFKGTPEKSRISGEVTFLEGRYYKDVRLGLIDSIGKRRREAPPATRAGTTPLLKNTEVFINVRHRTPFVVDNNIALMALKPTLSIHGALDNPIVSGRAQVESGLVSYLGKEFEIKKGVIDFLNPYKVEGTIDVDAEVKIRKWTINLKVSGTPENLKFEMTSNPAESDADIISLLVFNKTQSEMIKGEGGSNTSSKQILADMVAKSLEESLRDATGLDTIEMKYTEREDQDDADDVNITVGKELSKRITVKYGVGTKNGVTVQSAITEYKFYENVLMNAFRDTDGDFGGEMVFRLELR